MKSDSREERKKDLEDFIARSGPIGSVISGSRLQKQLQEQIEKEQAQNAAEERKRDLQEGKIRGPL